MKRIGVMILLVASLAATGTPGCADEPAKGQQATSPGTDQKDECLLILKNCEMQAESLQQTIKRLHEEIAKGTRVYNVEELKKLHQMLDDANRTLDLLLGDKQTLGM
jgi:hypothetical protein